MNSAVYRFLFILLITLYGVTPTAASELSQYDWFWFLYDQEHTSSYTSLVVRPFYLTHTEGTKRFDASLMPVLFWRYQNERKDDWRGLFGFFNSLDYQHDDDTPDYDFGLFPFLYYGNSPEKKDRYFLLWPFGGTMKGKFALERIDTVLFPGVLLFYFFPPASIFSLQTTAWLFISLMPLYVHYGRDDYQAHGILWPMVMWGKSDTRQDIRVLPFYAHKQKEGWYDRYSYVMIVNYEKQYFSKDTRYSFFLFPLFGRKWSDSGRISATTILWPFFSWGYDKKNESYHYNVPWPLVQLQDTQSPSVKKRIFFPFYGRYRYEEKETFFVTPLYFRLTDKTPVYRSEYHYSMFLFWDYRVYYKNAHSRFGDYWRYYKVWPLFSYEWTGAGARRFNFLSLLPFRDREGYEAMYEPFWSLLEYERRPDGERRFGLLMRTWYQRQGEDFYQGKVPLVFTLERQQGRTTRLTFLMSMFGYNENDDGTYLRFFWIPIRTGDSAYPLRDLSPVKRISLPDHVSMHRHAFPVDTSVGFSCNAFDI